MTDYAFSAIPMLERPAKPRGSGQTMMIDFGLGLHQQEDILQLASEYIDSAKIAVGVARLLPRELVMRKINLYKQYNVVPYPGGQFLEYAVLCGKVDAYFAEAAAVGFPAVEVSDNLLSISLDEKRALIAKAREVYNLEVFGEVGKKEGLAVTVSLEDDIRACLEAGSSKVLIEARKSSPMGVTRLRPSNLQMRRRSKSLCSSSPALGLKVPRTPNRTPSRAGSCRHSALT